MTQQSPSAKNIIEMSRQHGLIATTLYVMKTEPAGDMALIRQSLDTHLAYWIDLEKKNVLFAAGPFLPADENSGISGVGMVIYRADSLEQAIDIAAADPMHLSGARNFVVKPWLLNHLNAAGLV
jgi:uncharacterized protein YciI